MDYILKCKDPLFEAMIQKLIASKGVDYKSVSIEPCDLDGYIDVTNGDVFYNFRDDQNITYGNLKPNVWYLANLWLNPHLYSLSAGSANLDTFITSHDKTYGAKSFPVDKRVAVAFADVEYGSRLFFEDIL